MEIDKNVGSWSYYAIDIDDIAYYFYIIEEYNELYPIGQYTFMYNKYNHFSKYYHKAEMHLRKEKINKIIKKIYENKKRFCK